MNRSASKRIELLVNSFKLDEAKNRLFQVGEGRVMFTEVCGLGCIGEREPEAA
jgi:nitrogen regulatory protein PII